MGTVITLLILAALAVLLVNHVRASKVKNPPPAAESDTGDDVPYRDRKDIR